jgi:hypothetical protein
VEGRFTVVATAMQHLTLAFLAIDREFRQVGAALREHAVLRHVPIVALTATAVPRVQTDICNSLQLRNPFVSRQSLDRSNLRIRVAKKSGLAHAMKDLLAILNTPGIRASKHPMPMPAAKMTTSRLVIHSGGGGPPLATAGRCL